MSEYDRHLEYERRRKRKGSNQSGGGTGCLGCLVLIFAIWALTFGVTWAGHHYKIACTTERGVEVK